MTLILCMLLRKEFPSLKQMINTRSGDQHNVSAEEIRENQPAPKSLVEKITTTKMIRPSGEHRSKNAQHIILTIEVMDL